MCLLAIKINIFLPQLIIFFTKNIENKTRFQSQQNISYLIKEIRFISALYHISETSTMTKTIIELFSN